MGMGISTSDLHLSSADLDRMAEALHAAGTVILDDAKEKAPKESSALADSGSVADERGGDNTVGIVFDSVYARYQHEHLHFKHPHGGQAKFLELAMVEKGGDALEAAAEVLRS